MGISGAESKAKILVQLKRMVEEMRRIPPPQEQGISNVNGGQIWDCRLPGRSMCHGPSKTVHESLRGGFDVNPYPSVSQLIALQDGA